MPLELDEGSDINDEWTNFTTTFNKAATEHLDIERPSSKRKANKPALSKEQRKLNRQEKIARLKSDMKTWYSKMSLNLNPPVTTRKRFPRKIWNTLKAEQSPPQVWTIIYITSKIRKDDGEAVFKWSLLRMSLFVANWGYQLCCSCQRRAVFLTITTTEASPSLI